MILKKSFRFLLFLLISIPSYVYAYSEYVIAGGQNIGINIKTPGVMVVGTYEVKGEKISAFSNIRVGDNIISMNNKKITSIEDMTTIINNTNCDNVNISYERENKIYNTMLHLKEENNVCKTGLYVKDNVTGIGTLTFIDPKTKIFGALGHEIIEKNTGSIIETTNGTIFNSEVLGIERSRNGIPGEKNAKYYSNQVKGNIYENTKQGIFGYYSNIISNENMYKVANVNEIKTGKATIRTVLNGTEIKEYEILITRLVNNQDTKNIYFDITDEELLKQAGGIVQGMSGSPIIQGDYIVGAVTHVVVDNPTKGYGIYITNMLKEAEN